MSTESDPQKAVQAIEQGAAEVRSAASELTKRIVAFERWLGKLPGKVTASCEMSSTDDGNFSSMLGFERRGSDWVLTLWRTHNPSDSVHDERLLRDASIEDKAFAIGFFPQLLADMVIAQKNRVKSAQRAALEFDEFAKRAGVKEGA